METPEAVTRMGGVAHNSQLQHLGIAPETVRNAVRSGSVIRIRRGWVHVPGAPADLVRAVRVGGSLTCVSLLATQGVWCASDSLLHVRVGRHTSHLADPDDRSNRLGDPTAHGIRLHRTLSNGRPMPVSAQDSVEEALMQIVLCQGRDHAVAAIDSSLRLNLTSRYRMRVRAERLGQKHREAVGLADPSSQSGLETKARLRLRALGISYRTQVEVSSVGAVDLVVGDRIVIELDGRRWHSAETAFAEDRRRDFILHERGYLVLRFTYAQVMFEWDRIEALIRTLVARGEHRWGRRQMGAELGRGLGVGLGRGLGPGLGLDARRNDFRPPGRS